MNEGDQTVILDCRGAPSCEIRSSIFGSKFNFRHYLRQSVSNLCSGTCID